MKNANLLDDPGKNERSPLRAGLGIAGSVALAAVLLIAFLVTHPATASDGDNSEASSPPAQSEGLPSAPPESQPPTQTEPVVTTEDPEGAVALEELLDAEQIEVFTAAVDVYLHLFGGDTDEVNFWENGRQSPQEWETVEIGGMEYTKSWGPYANYADFDALIRSVFSEQFWEERNDVLSNGLGLFRNVDGTLYYISVGGGSGYDYNWDVPDTYRLVDRTDDTVTFTIVGHYASIFPREDGTYGHTAEFPVRMVLTEDGWRIDQLYLHGVDYHMLPKSAGLENREIRRKIMMENLKLAEVEYRFVCIVWENEPLPSGKLVELCAEKLGWKKSTTYTVLKRLVERGVLRNENSVVTAAVAKEDVLEEESHSVVDKTFDGSLPSFLTAFLGRRAISKREAEELKSLIDRFRKDEGDD